MLCHCTLLNVAQHIDHFRDFSLIEDTGYTVPLNCSCEISLNGKAGRHGTKRRCRRSTGLGGRFTSACLTPARNGAEQQTLYQTDVAG
jgi:hypothetical protein